MKQSSQKKEIAFQIQKANNDGEEMQIETTPVVGTSLKELTYDVSTGKWVKVLYEDEIFLGKVQKKVHNEYYVQCLEKTIWRERTSKSGEK